MRDLIFDAFITFCNIRIIIFYFFRKNIFETLCVGQVELDNLFDISRRSLQNLNII